MQSNSSIGTLAFAICTRLTAIDTGEKVKTIGSGAFLGCNGATTVTVGNGAETINNQAFYNCTGATTLTIGTGVTVIGMSAFDSMISVTTFNFNAINCGDLPSNVKSFRSLSSNTSNGANFNIGASVTKIPTYMFNDSNVKLSEINYLTYEKDGAQVNDCKTIGAYAFYGVSGLSEINISNFVEDIGEYAFAGCNQTDSIVIGEQVKTIGNFAFLSTLNTSSVYFNAINMNDLSAENGIFYGCGYEMAETETPLKLIVGSKVTKIPAYLFGGSESEHTHLKEIDFSNASALVYINSHAFSNGTGNNSENYYPLAGHLNFPATLRHVGDYAFEYTSIAGITFNGPMTYIGVCSFNYCELITNTTVIIPESSESALALTIANYAFTETPISILCLPSYINNIGRIILNNVKKTIYYNGSLAGWLNVTITDTITDIETEFYFSDNTGLDSSYYTTTTYNYPAASTTYYKPTKLTINSNPKGHFAYWNQLTEVEITSSVTEIGEYTFYSCKNLHTVWLNHSVTSIKDQAFGHCIALAETATDTGNKGVHYSNSRSYRAVNLYYNIVGRSGGANSNKRLLSAKWWYKVIEDDALDDGNYVPEDLVFAYISSDFRTDSGAYQYTEYNPGEPYYIFTGIGDLFGTEDTSQGVTQSRTVRIPHVYDDGAHGPWFVREIFKMAYMAERITNSDGSVEYITYFDLFVQMADDETEDEPAKA